MNCSKISCRLLSAEESIEYSENMKALPIEQSQYWGTFQDSMSDRVYLGMYGVFENNEVVALATAIYITMRGYSYIWCKQGPYVIENGELKMENIMSVLSETIENVCKDKFSHLPTPLFLRIHASDEIRGTTPAFTNYIRKTLQLDLQVSEEDILAQMKQKGRYNIRIADKKGVTVHSFQYGSKGYEEALNDFYKILQETSSRDGFSHHMKEYYNQMMKYLEKKATLYMAEYEGEYISGIIVTFFHNIALYYYGASHYKYRKLMAPYALQWQAIQDAKNKGCKVYDFLGISEIEGDSLSGVTQFKKKFGGKEISFLNVYDIPYSKVKYFGVKYLKKLFEILR